MVKNKHPRHYKKITPQTVALHKARTLSKGNGSLAVREYEPEYSNEGDRAYRIQKKSDDVNTLDYIDQSLQQIGESAIVRLDELVNSNDERVAGVNTRYVIDQLRGKALSKNISLTAKVNIQSVLD